MHASTVLQRNKCSFEAIHSRKCQTIAPVNSTSSSMKCKICLLKAFSWPRQEWGNRRTIRVVPQSNHPNRQTCSELTSKHLLSRNYKTKRKDKSTWAFML